MIRFQSNSSMCGIAIPLKQWDIEKLVDPDELVIQNSSICILYDKTIIQMDISPLIKYTKKDGFTRRHIVEMINSTLLRFYEEEIKGERCRGIQPMAIFLYGIMPDEQNHYRLVVDG